MHRFDARGVAVEELEDLNTFLVAFAECEDGSGDRLELQRAIAFDKQDRRLGFDTYCLCVERGAHHGGVTSWALRDDSLEVRLDDDAAAALGIDDGFFVTFQVTEAMHRKLKAGLARIFDESASGSPQRVR